MKRIILSVLAITVSVLALAQPQPKKLSADKIVAVVGDKIILKSDIDNSIIDMQRQGIEVPENANCMTLEQAMGIYRDLGSRGGEAMVLNQRGTLHRVSSDLAQAEGCHQQALELARAIASSWDEAHAFAGLGRCALAVGDATQAELLLRQALEIFQRIGAAEAPDLLAELDTLTGPPTAQ